MGDYAREVRKLLLAAGCWAHRRGRGDHEIWKSPLADKPVTVPDVIKSRHTANGILKEAGLPKAF